MAGSAACGGEIPRPDAHEGRHAKVHGAHQTRPAKMLANRKRLLSFTHPFLVTRTSIHLNFFCCVMVCFHDCLLTVCVRGWAQSDTMSSARRSSSASSSAARSFCESDLDTVKSFDELMRDPHEVTGLPVRISCLPTPLLF